MTRTLLVLTLLSAAIIGCQDPAGTTDDDQEHKPSLREIVLDGAPPESASVALFQSPSASLREVLARINEIRVDDDAKGIFVRVAPFGGAWARSFDIARALSAVRAAHKPVHCYFEVADNASYSLLASSCDRVTMTPAGDLDLVGVAAHLFHGRQLLASLGVSAELLQMGRFKGAAEPFTRDDMSPETRESMGALLDDLQGSLVQSVATGRHIESAQVTTLINAGPYDSNRARAARLVDAVAFADEALEAAKNAAHVHDVERVRLRDASENIGLNDIIKAFTEEHEAEESSGSRVALVVLDGSISDGEGRGGDLGASIPFVRTMERLAEEDDVKAVVLRIDSPGGSALASDVMWHAVARLAAKKPVIASIGDMAASGGYYIACATNRIFAEDASIVGSIGVVGGKVNVQDLLTRIGVHAEILARGEHAGWSAPTQPFSEAERAVLHTMLQSTYDRFIERVSTGRHMDRARVLAAAEGRIWSARRGRGLGLVDDIGSLDGALAYARTAAHLPADAPVELWPKHRTIVDVISRMLGVDGGNESGEETRALFDLAYTLVPGLDRFDSLRAVFAGRDRVAVALPFLLQIR
jgi:protease-4